MMKALHAAGVKLHLASGTDEVDLVAEAKSLGHAALFEGRIHGAVGNVSIEAKKVVLEKILAEISAKEAGSLVAFGDGPVEIRETKRRGGYADRGGKRRASPLRSKSPQAHPGHTGGRRPGRPRLLAVEDAPRASWGARRNRTCGARVSAMFDRRKLFLKPLSERRNKVVFPKDAISPDAAPGPMAEQEARTLQEAVQKIRAARAAGRPVMCAFGAHTIKNGLGPVLVRLVEQGWITHLATNGAGIIHDWELAYQGRTSEDVRQNMPHGEFGTWDETGRFINLALLVGAWKGFGYGQSIGALIAEQGLDIPSVSALRAEATRLMDEDPDRSAAAVDLLAAVRDFELPAGRMNVPHPFGAFSAQAAAYRQGAPFTGHPMIGHDIIYTHPMNSGAAIGRTALRDFLVFAEAVSRLEGGVYLSVGSAVMSPMVFEKSLSMAQNLAYQQGRAIKNHHIVVVDIAESTWDWQKDGEPPMDNPAYYLRSCKTFSRMGGTMRYLRADNRAFFLSLLHSLLLS